MIEPWDGTSTFSQRLINTASEVTRIHREVTTSHGYHSSFMSPTTLVSGKFVQKWWEHGLMAASTSTSLWCSTNFLRWPTVRVKKLPGLRRENHGQEVSNGMDFNQSRWQRNSATWWFIPLSKWVATLVVNGISGVSRLITGVITHLLSGMNHQVLIRLIIYTTGFVTILKLLISCRGPKKCHVMPFSMGTSSSKLIQAGGKLSFQWNQDRWIL